MLLALLLGLAGFQDVPGPKVEQDSNGTQRWSILADPCAPAYGNEIVVCGQGAETNPRLPLPAERGIPDHPIPSNPDLSGMGALMASIPPCSTRSEGCTTGIDLFGGTTFLVRAVGKAVDPDSCCEDPGESTNPIALFNDIGSVIHRTFKKKPDKSKRVPIPLDDPVPTPTASASENPAQ